MSTNKSNFGYYFVPLQYILRELVRNVKQRVGSSLVMPKGNPKEPKLLNPQKLTLRQVESVEAEGRQGIIVRGPRDELDLKIFG